MKERVFIVHRWGATPKDDWYFWLKKELETQNYEVHIPAMPNTDEPEISAWVNTLKKSVKKCDNATHFVGHSIGCQTIMRYVEESKEQCGNIVFVAGWFYLKNLESKAVVKIAQPWLETPVDTGKVRENCQGITVFLSENDPYNCIEENKKAFKERLAAKVIIEPEKGHFTAEDKVTKVSEVVRALDLW